MEFASFRGRAFPGNHLVHTEQTYRRTDGHTKGQTRNAACNDGRVIMALLMQLDATMSSEDTLTGAAETSIASEAAPPSVDLLHSTTSHHHHHLRHHLRHHLCPQQHRQCESSSSASVGDVGYPQTASDDLLQTEACRCCCSDTAASNAARDYDYLPCRYNDNVCSAVVITVFYEYWLATRKLS